MELPAVRRTQPTTTVQISSTTRVQLPQWLHSKQRQHHKYSTGCLYHQGCLAFKGLCTNTIFNQTHVWNLCRIVIYSMFIKYRPKTWNLRKLLIQFICSCCCFNCFNHILQYLFQFLSLHLLLWVYNVSVILKIKICLPRWGRATARQKAAATAASTAFPP